jgi:hypothetical protein
LGGGVVVVVVVVVVMVVMVVRMGGGGGGGGRGGKYDMSMKKAAMALRSCVLESVEFCAVLHCSMLCWAVQCCVMLCYAETTALHVHEEGSDGLEVLEVEDSDAEGGPLHTTEAVYQMSGKC